jgi:hypothetical protein
MFDKGTFSISGNLKLTSDVEGCLTILGLNLKGCTGLTKLPQKIIVLDTLNLSDCVSLKELPENFYYGGAYTRPSYIEPKIND